MVKVYPPPVDELVERLRTFIEWEMWYRKKMFPNQLGLRRQKVQEAEAAARVYIGGGRTNAGKFKDELAW